MSRPTASVLVSVVAFHGQVSVIVTMLAGCLVIAVQMFAHKCPGIGPNMIANCPPPVPPCAPAPVSGACYDLVIWTDPTCCSVAWTPACQDMYDGCTEVTPTSGSNFVVPACVTDLYVTAGGGSGGGPNGGQGAQIYGTIPVGPGDIVVTVNGTAGSAGVGGVPGG